ncbi:hypothetical protein HPULCUR_004239 [Helicostylum pulchrum]|uniref:RING-type domain-containing protein n=1 Tax=Helicostylum pulchrum TaxID=562976 RepID=A0ABP9XX35_9FUNG
MSESEQEEVQVYSDSGSEEESGSTLQQTTDTEQSKSWPSISSIMTLFSGSRPNQENIELTKEDDTIDEELSCPICQEIMVEVFSTKCGHSFCYACITLHIDRQPDCPLCRSRLTRADINPNFQHLVEIFNLAVKEKKNADIDQNKVKEGLLRHFLTKLKKENKKTINDLINQNNCITSDFKELMNQDEQQLRFSINQRKRKYSQIQGSETEAEEEEVASSQQSITTASLSEYEDSLSERLDSRFYDLKELYRDTLATGMTKDKRKQLLTEFSSTMYELLRYNRYNVIDKLNYADNKTVSTIVSSIEFDRDQELFAVGGVTKQIKIFDFNMMGYYPNGVHCPTRIINCDYKISCLSWSPYIKSQLASSDYQGYIHIWDVSTGQKTTEFREHKRRAWSVDICHQNPTIIASASDDTTVKVWSLSEPDSIFTLEQKGNVCCAKFAPNSSHYLAVGSADHFVSCFDLRFPKQPVKVYEGHRKAVSYVKWLNDDEIISASTDSTLKLWNRESMLCKRTYEGHQNEKNFVGLSINGDWISCGSETNTVYTYHKKSKYPVTEFKFPSTSETGSDGESDEDPPVFVSSVCWKKGTNSILAANSKGLITALEME